MAERLITIAKKMNVGLGSIVEFLAFKGHLIDNKPTTVVSDELYDVLTQGLIAYLAEKDAAGQFVIGKGNGFVKKNDIPMASDLKSKEVNLINELPKQIFTDELNLNIDPSNDTKNEIAYRKPNFKVIGLIDISRLLKDEIREVKEEHPEIKLWRNFIEANKAIILEKERPLKVGAIESIENIKFKGREITRVRVGLIKFQKNKLIENAVKEAGIAINHFRYDEQANLLNLPITVTTEQIDTINRHLHDTLNFLNKKDQKAIIKFKIQPSFSGTIEIIDPKYKEIYDLLNIGIKSHDPNVIHSTFKEIDKIDLLEKEYQYIKRDKIITAILKVNYFDNNKIIEKYFDNSFGLKIHCSINRKLTVCTIRSRVLIENINDMVKDLGITPIDLELKNIVFEVINENGAIEIEKIEYCFNNHDLAIGLDLPRLQQQYPSGKFLYYEFRYEILLEGYEMLYTFIENQILLYTNSLRENGYVISTKQESTTLAFDFINRNDFEEKYSVIRNDAIISTVYDSKKEDTAFKIRVTFTPPELNKISLAIRNKFQLISVRYDKKGNNLIFRLPYDNHDEITEIKNYFFGLQKIVNITYHNDPLYKSYYCDIDLIKYDEIIKDKINLIKNTEMYYQREQHINGTLIGNLISANNDLNELTLYLNDKTRSKDVYDLFQENIWMNAIKADMTGDKKKNEYLEQALNKINEPVPGFNGSPVNTNIRNYIFDSTEAKHLSYDELKPESDNWLNITNNLYSENINTPQIESVVKAVYSQDLALLQGPPGTGKTTVIAEIIWQLLRKDPQHKILLTSESNLAVDNALERLKSNQTNIIKPIRLGNNVQEEEGLYFHINRIEEWSSTDYNNDLKFNTETLESEDLNNNVVYNWMNRIAFASEQVDTENCEILQKWRKNLRKPNKNLKTIFKENYYNNVNVVGNTCSSAGSPSFLQSYQNLYNTKEIEFISKDRIITKFDVVKYYYTLKRNNRNYHAVEKILEEVVFDTVIMDEASKATPPELLLPLCYGKKNIIIGDHRQLPPTLKELDDEGFQATLEEIGETNLALEWQTKADMKVSQFKKLISNAPKEIIGVFNLQYRMHPQINNVIRQFYLEDGGLNPGPELIENCELHYNTNHPLSRYHGFSHEGFITPDIHTLWINVDEPERKDGFSYVNDGEVEAIRRVLNYIKNSDGFKEYSDYWISKNKLEENEIGIISFYAKQLGALKQMLNQVQGLNVRLKTVDRFQGMEKNIIIVSTVRSNKKIDFQNQIQNFSEYPNNNGYTKNNSLGFANSPERINVALSRAKRLLIVVGNSDHFATNLIYRNVIETIKNNSTNSETYIDYKNLNLY